MVCYNKNNNLPSYIFSMLQLNYEIYKFYIKINEYSMGLDYLTGVVFMVCYNKNDNPPSYIFSMLYLKYEVFNSMNKGVLV